MRSSVFKIKASQIDETRIDETTQLNLWKIHIPILSAYSIEYITEHWDPLSGVLANECVNGNIIEYQTDFQKAEVADLFMIIHYHGIKDYEALFPWIINDNLRKRIATFYEELESNFENGVWLSALLLSGAVLEGILAAKLGKMDKTLNDLITLAKERRLVNESDATLLTEIRKYRNIVHANKYRDEYVTKQKAMDVRSIIDRIIKNFAGC
ncbi:hypothetical protein [Lysinibacillus fusiformis]|uniref:hypothetical protein n=1 Tax=Lysinibacillus fusiformis TaxID=28031 RepID=UPI00196876ED|nr:hypothetical protein [Lysinibacillus fusiformis]QSB09304.1 hypothetical protein JTI58_20210 [Lysinibacillus fusiformis]UXJ70911.1 hypothetical protein N5069_10345 [Lysinibacillus fusiformis]